jgi:Fe-S cluster assembly protein SufD
LYCTSAIQLEFDDSENETIELIFKNTANAAIFPRLFIQCNKGAKGTVILNFQGAEQNASFINVSTYVNVGENANLSINKIQKNGADTFDLQREYVDQAANSTFTMNTFPLSGRLTRNDLKINVNGNNCETFMNGAYTLKGKSHCDNHTTVDHKVAHCYSKELYKGVIDDRATNVFNGKVFVRKDAQKINAFQSNANILLSDTGTVNSKPELEIYADDVKCSHGSTTGQLDDEAVFYLRSRGLSEKTAKELLVKAFLGEVLEEVENEEVSSYVEAQIEQHFSA